MARTLKIILILFLVNFSALNINDCYSQEKFSKIDSTLRIIDTSTVRGTIVYFISKKSNDVNIRGINFCLLDTLFNMKKNRSLKRISSLGYIFILPREFGKFKNIEDLKNLLINYKYITGDFYRKLELNNNNIRTNRGLLYSANFESVLVSAMIDVKFFKSVFFLPKNIISESGYIKILMPFVP